jgi:hypothetical protein
VVLNVIVVVLVMVLIGYGVFATFQNHSPQFLRCFKNPLVHTLQAEKKEKRLEKRKQQELIKALFSGFQLAYVFRTFTSRRARIQN